MLQHHVPQAWTGQECLNTVQCSRQSSGTGAGIGTCNAFFGVGEPLHVSSRQAGISLAIGPFPSPFHPFHVSDMVWNPTGSNMHSTLRMSIAGMVDQAMHTGCAQSNILPSTFGRQSATKLNPDMALVGRYDKHHFPTQRNLERNSSLNKKLEQC